jgi:cell division transport system permease protein
MLKRSLIEALKNLTRSIWLSLTAISVLTVSLASVALVATISTTIGFAVRNLDNLISVPAFLVESYPEENVAPLLDKIRSIPEVKQVKYFNKEDAQQELSQGTAGLNLDFLKTQGSGNSLAWRYVLITPKQSENYGALINILKSQSFEGTWEEVPGDQSFVDNLVKFNRWVRIIGVVLILVFAAISILVMANILRITIYSHRDEIEIMRLVGATNSYIRMPFIVEGVYYNLIAAAIVTAFFVPLFNLNLPNIAKWIGGDLTGVSGSLLFQMYLIFGLTLFFGMTVGVITSYMATQKYLKL